jgi:2-polyprenyl-3-methyl-5-hydroxy-6-metoxy-1,4-benzoquinol methylase
VSRPLGAAGVERAAFDGWVREFRAAIEAAGKEYRSDSPFLASQIGMLDSLRYLDRLYLDLCGFGEFLKPGARVLDLGTGCGIAAWLTASLGFQTDAIDVDDFFEGDIHRDMASAQIALWRVLERQRAGLRFRHYPGDRIPFGDAEFDAVIAYGVIEHIPEALVEPVMRDTGRVTRPGGALMVSYLPRTWAWLEWANRLLGRPHHDRCWGDREIRLALTGWGYRVERMERIIFAPQYPPVFANRHKRLFDAMDRLAGIPPFAWFARDLFFVAAKGSP